MNTKMITNYNKTAESLFPKTSRGMRKLKVAFGTSESCPSRSCRTSSIGGIMCEGGRITPSGDVDF
jgi:hypothetical protein